MNKAVAKLALEAEKKLMLDWEAALNRIFSEWESKGRITKATAEAALKELNNKSAKNIKNINKGIQLEAIKTITKKAGLDAEIAFEVLKDLGTPKLSTALHAANKKTMEILYSQVKESIAAGDSLQKATKALLKIETPKDVSKYMERLWDLAHQAVVDPSLYGTYKKELEKIKGYAESLTREGAEGFQHLGIRGATKRALTGIEKAVNDGNKANIEKYFEIIAKRKAKYAIQRVVRTETSKAYNQQTVALAMSMSAGATLPEAFHSAPHHPNCLCRTDPLIEGGEVVGMVNILSESHPKPDICDELAGKYYFVNIAKQAA